MVKVKICGITHEEDALWAASLGAEYLGFNFWTESPRHINRKKAKDIIGRLPPFVTPIGVFVNPAPKDIESCVRELGLKGIQLHGNQTMEDINLLRQNLADITPEIFIVKALSIASSEDVESAAEYAPICDFFLLDAKQEGQWGGTGQTFPWKLAEDTKKRFNKSIFLAGGLTPENVRKAVSQIQPYAVDVASGVEKSPRRKDYEKLKAFISEAKR